MLNGRQIEFAGYRSDPILLRTTDAYGLPADAKEAIAFAAMASGRIDEHPSSVAAVSGARGHVLLGKITEC